ncbi:MAG: hypothetical protein ACYTG0_23985 [Planctomycetota bacterium]|jgi:hypothetical protein
MSLVILKWLAVAGISFATVEYCGSKLIPGWESVFEKAARATSVAVGGVLVGLVVMAIRGNFSFVGTATNNLGDTARRLAREYRDAF